MKDINLTYLTKSLQSFIGRFHAIMFFGFVALLLSIAIFMIFRVVTSEPDASLVEAGQIQTTFDEDTISRINELNGGGTRSILLPADKRINPFTSNTNAVTDFCTSTARLENPARVAQDCDNFMYLDQEQ